MSLYGDDEPTNRDKSTQYGAHNALFHHPEYGLLLLPASAIYNEKQRITPTMYHLSAHQQLHTHTLNTPSTHHRYSDIPLNDPSAHT